MGYTIGNGAALVGVLFLLLMQDTTSSWMLYVFVMLYGLGFGSMAPMTATATADLFPGSSLGRILALQSMGFGIGGAAGAYLGAYFHDRTGSYFLPFSFLLVSLCIGIFGIWKAGPRYRVLVRRQSGPSA
jgi:MFS family permease